MFVVINTMYIQFKASKYFYFSFQTIETPKLRFDYFGFLTVKN